MPEDVHQGPETEERYTQQNHPRGAKADQVPGSRPSRMERNLSRAAVLGGGAKKGFGFLVGGEGRGGGLQAGTLTGTPTTGSNGFRCPEILGG